MLSKSEIESRLKNAPNGTYLVRFSSHLGCFAISKPPNKKGGATLHFLINHKFDGPYTFGSRSYNRIDQIIFHKKLDMNLMFPCPDSPLQALFTIDTKKSRYCNFSDDED